VLIVVLLHASFAVAAAPSPASTPRTITLDDFGRAQAPGQPRFSPDGKSIAFDHEGRIFVVATEGGAPRAVTSTGSAAWSPGWSDDGRVLYFLSDRSGKSQLWKLPLDAYGEAMQVTTLDRGVDSLDFSPDRSKLLLSFRGSAPPPAEDAWKQQKDSPEQKKPAQPWVITRLHFKEDAGDGYLTGDAGDHLYVHDVNSKSLNQLTSGRYSESDADWSPDGRSIVFASNREREPDADYRSDLWIARADDSNQDQSLSRVTNDEYEKGSPQWSPDGKSIAFISAVDGVYGIHQLALVPASGGDTRILTASLDRWVDSFRFSSDGVWLYFLYEDLGATHLARVRTRDGKLEMLFEGPWQISAFDVAASGAIVARMETSDRPAELYVLRGRKPHQITNLNDAWLRTVVLGTKESIEYSSKDGTKIQAFVTKPPGFDPARKYPTLLHVHGGPVSQFAYGYSFTTQLLAANGYVVVEPNPRGSTGRGQNFIRGIYQTWGITDYDDLIAAVDYAIAQGYADPDRLGVFGYSYGGYMTNTIITRTNRFKAAASGAGHSLIVANYGHDIYQKWYSWELGVPWENREKYDRLSPLTQAAKVTTPTIFLGGRDDWNVPVLNAELFYQALRKRGIETELVVYPGTHHGNWSEEFEKDYLVRVRDWFGKHLGASDAGTVTGLP